jgi:nickel-type superoxide dismutase maturation protease
MGLVTAGLWRWHPVTRVEVEGTSMAPALLPGDRLLVLRPGRVMVGDVVALSDPRMPARAMVKRVAALGPDGVTVLGDNAAASTDSRSLGPVPPAAIKGRVVYRYLPENRRGPVA